MLGKNIIENIILDYCEGREHLKFSKSGFSKLYSLEFSKSDLPEMIKKIKQAIINEIDDAEHLDDARRYVNDYL